MTPESIHEGNERFKTLLNFRGWGNPKNAIWFVGIEEGSDWTKNECEDDYRKNQDIQRELKEFEYTSYVDLKIKQDYAKQWEPNNYSDKECLRKVKLYYNIGKLCYKLIYKDETCGQIKETIDNEIKDCMNKGSFSEQNFCVTNLFPIGVKDSSCDTWVKCFNEYKSIFALEDGWYDKSEYINSKDVKNRLSELQKQASAQAKIIICLGTGHNNEFIKTFLYAEENKSDKEITDLTKAHWTKFKDANVWYYNDPGNKLVILPHISYPRNFKLVCSEKELIDNLRRKLNK